MAQRTSLLERASALTPRVHMHSERSRVRPWPVRRRTSPDASTSRETVTCAISRRLAVRCSATTLRMPSNGRLEAAADTPRSVRAAPAAASTHSGQLLDALKEELFQLEMEHKQGQITDQEYAKNKSALDQTLARAIKRSR